MMAITSGILMCLLIALRFTTSDTTQNISIYSQTLPSLYENNPNRTRITSNTTIIFFGVQSILQSNMVFRDLANLSLQFVLTNLYCSEGYGLVFINITNLEISGMTITNCGMELSQTLIQHALKVQSNSNFQLTQGLKVAVYVVNVHNLLIEFSNISKSHGYGFLGINVLGNSVLHFVDIIGSNAAAALDKRCKMQDITSAETARCQGGNALFLYGDLPFCPYSLQTFTLTLNKTYISSGVNPLVPYTIYQAESSIAGGLAIIEAQANYIIRLNLISSTFIRNRGGRGGNILIQLPNTVISSSVTIQSCLSVFGVSNFPVYITIGSLYLTDAIRNHSECKNLRDRANMRNRLEPLTIENSNFIFNAGGGINVFVTRSYLPLYLIALRPVFVVSIINCTIRGNLALGPTTGAASGLAIAEVAYGEHHSTELIVVGTTFENNLHTKLPGQSVHRYVSTSRIQSIGKAIFRDCTFSGNNYSAILADNSNIFFEGTNTFFNNTSPYGGALYISSSTKILLKPNSEVLFTNNYASEKGGAIFVDVSALNSFQRCSIEVFDPEYLKPSDLNIYMVFTNNSAGIAGDVYYGGPLHLCAIQSVSELTLTNINGDFTFNFVANFSGQNSSRSLISSHGTKICFCHEDHVQNNCTKLLRQTTFLSHYPGELFEVLVITRDQNSNPVPSVIVTGYNFAGKYDFREVSDTSYCNSLMYRLQDTGIGFELFYIIPTDLLSFEETSILIVVVDFLKCTNLTGFALDDSTKYCECVLQLQERNMTCDIDTKTITRQPPYWLGNYSNNLLLHDNCPYDYCKPISVQIVMTEPNISEQCAFDRYGTLCGSCREGFSLVFGTSRCLKCSNSYLSLLILFALAGIALIALLLIFNLTVQSGKINGFLFYANIVHINGQLFFTSEQNPLKVFISWVNLDLGIETCFYNGMRSYTKLWLQFLFPFYLIVVLALVAIIHRALLYKKHNNSEACYLFVLGKLGRRIIPVLATVLLLSFTKVIRIIFTVLSFTTLDYPDGRRFVWLYNGNQKFGKGSHFSLLLFSLIFLAFAIVPYILLLLILPVTMNKKNCLADKLRKPVTKLSTLKKIIDDYLNPYKNSSSYWTALLLVTRMFHALVFASTLGDPGVNRFVVMATAFLLVILNLAVGGVYKNLLLTMLETMTLLNVGILAAATALNVQIGASQTIVTNLSITIAIIPFASVYIYQALMMCAAKHRLRYCYSKLFGLAGRESINITNLERQLQDIPTCDREQPKPCVTTTIIAGIPEEIEEEEQSETAL